MAARLPDLPGRRGALGKSIEARVAVSAFSSRWKRQKNWPDKRPGLIMRLLKFELSHARCQGCEETPSRY
jgi:hypothetical protein